MIKIIVPVRKYFCTKSVANSDFQIFCLREKPAIFEVEPVDCSWGLTNGLLCTIPLAMLKKRNKSDFELTEFLYFCNWKRERYKNPYAWFYDKFKYSDLCYLFSLCGSLLWEFHKF